MKPVLLNDYVKAIKKIDPDFTLETQFFSDSVEIGINGEHLNYSGYDTFTITWRGQSTTFYHYQKALKYCSAVYNFVTQ
jgi:hypothetical protein